MFLKRAISTIIALAGISIMMPAQSLVPLQADTTITVGELRNGISYYLAIDTSKVGYADMAVILNGEPVSEASDARLDSPRAGTVAPIRFFSGNGSGPRPEGYFTDNGGSTVYRFDRIPVGKKEVADSAFLAAFGIISTTDVPSAIVLSGDIDPKTVKDRMDLISMIVRPLYAKAPAFNYVWEPTPVPTFFSKTGTECSVSVSYAAPRTPRRMMNTAQPLVMDIFSRELSLIVRHRLEREFRSRKIPYRSIDYEHTNSFSGDGDELYKFTVKTDSLYMEEALNALGRVFGALESQGATPVEFLHTRRVLGREIGTLGKTPRKTDRCIAAYLYGGSLATPEEESILFARKNVSDSAQLALFNRIADALLDQRQGVHIEYVTPKGDVDDNKVLFDYNLAYLVGYYTHLETDYSWRMGDTLGLNIIAPKTKIKEARRDPIGEGSIWTFTNGLKTVLMTRRTEYARFSFSLSFPGGYQSIPGLKPGETLHYDDIIRLAPAGGLTGYDFFNMLKTCDIDISLKLTSSELRLEGSAPSTRLPLFFGALADITARRDIPAAEKDYYLKCSLMDEEAFDRAADFIESRFSNVNGAILTLVGDLDEGVVKKLLMESAAAFRSDRTKILRRTAVSPRKMPDFAGVEDGIVITFPYQVSSTSYFTMHAAAEALRREVVRRLAPLGYYADVEAVAETYPEERMHFVVTFGKADKEGMPSISEGDARDAVKKAIYALAANNLPKRDIDLYKKMVRSSMESALSDNDTWRDLIALRYISSKDFVSTRKESINAINQDKMRLMFFAASSGKITEL